MSHAVSRRKEPEAVRLALLESAAQIAAQQGFSAVTVQMVATAAGVTKGGLFHHFANKQALLEGMFSHQLEKLDRLIDVHMAADPQPYGMFTRAYVAAVFDPEHFGRRSVWAAMAASLAADPALRRLWAQWYAARCERHRATDGDNLLEIVRLAADGAWFSYLMDEPAPGADSLCQQLMTMSLPKD